jgi:hypothetical protein
MIDWLLINVPLGLLALLVIVVPSLVAMAAVWGIRRRVPADVLAQNNDLGATYFGIVGTIYAIFLGFTVVIVWDDLGQADAIVNQESSTIVSLYLTARALPAPTGDRAQQQLQVYTLAVRDVEWETMARGEGSPQVQEALTAVWETLTGAEPATAGQVAMHTEAVARLSELSRQRQLRLQASEASVSGIFWTVLMAGAVVTVGFACFFAMPSVRTQVAMTGLMTGMIMSGLFLVLVLDRPFTGSIRAEPEAFEHALLLMTGPGRG